MAVKKFHCHKIVFLIQHWNLMNNLNSQFLYNFSDTIDSNHAWFEALFLFLPSSILLSLPMSSVQLRLNSETDDEVPRVLSPTVVLEFRKLDLPCEIRQLQREESL
mmetsp:Transcript_21071/g.29170  ORF Transcript_21071/g.29170 Transcript_21071/m.29170 type:complete len:106 (+) Transcript_21071:14-331(+)